jgi:DNA-binding NtrC family response regulator
MATILAIDDSISVLAWLENELSSAGHEVITCSDGGQGEKLLRERAVDLIITDIYMPERDGIELIQHARQIAPGVKVIAISGAPPKLDMLRAARALGAAHTLKKPFNLEQLIEAVNGTLGVTTNSAKRSMSPKGQVSPTTSKEAKRSGGPGRQPRTNHGANAATSLSSRASTADAHECLIPEA